MEPDNSKEFKKLIEEAARVMSLADKHWQAGAITDREVNQAHTRVAQLLAKAIVAMDKGSAK